MHVYQIDMRDPQQDIIFERGNLTLVVQMVTPKRWTCPNLDLSKHTNIYLKYEYIYLFVSNMTLFNINFFIKCTFQIV